VHEHGFDFDALNRPHAGPSVAANAEPPALPFTIGNAIGAGGRGFSRRYGLLLGASALYLLILLGAKMVGFVSSFVTLLPLVEWAGAFLFYPIILLGLLEIGHRAVRDRRATASDLFLPFRRYWPVVGASAIVTLGVVLIFLVPAVLVALFFLLLAVSGGGSPGGGIGMTVAFSAMGLMLLLFLGLFPRLMFAPMVCLDTEMRTSGPVESVKIAWAMTGRRGVRLRLAALLVLGYIFAGICALLVLLPLLFVAMPLGIAVYGAAYWQISHAYWTAREHRCRRCEYDLRDTRMDRCPECGTPVPPEQLAYTGFTPDNDASTSED
jgi:hypothetical protein